MQYFLSRHGPIFAAVLATLPLPAMAEEGIDYARRDYETSCALCHGQNGRDDGSLNFMQEMAILDLTTLSRENGGVFPAQRAYDAIDGQTGIKAHGPREMPIWEVGMKSGNDDYSTPGTAVFRRRILALVDHLKRIQMK